MTVYTVQDSFVFVAVTTTCFMLPWQFAQFALLTTTLSVFATYSLRFIDARKVNFMFYSRTLFSLCLRFGRMNRRETYILGIQMSEHIQLDPGREISSDNTHNNKIKVYSFYSNHMWLTCRNHFGNVLYSVLTQGNALYT